MNTIEAELIRHQEKLAKRLAELTLSSNVRAQHGGRVWCPEPAH
jgi:hypothetical protein